MAVRVEVGQGGTKLYSRNHNDFKKRFPPIVEALFALKPPSILDGEIVALDEHGHSRFEWWSIAGNNKDAGLLRV
jgi:bifunctional non-homologous end joining protein LigD